MSGHATPAPVRRVGSAVAAERFSRAQLVPPSDGGFVVFAAEVDRRLWWLLPAGRVSPLDNSTVLEPVADGATSYGVINHCRWDRLRDVLPALVFRRSFQEYVLAHFDANDTAPMPIFYRLA